MIARRVLPSGRVRWVARYETPEGREVSKTFDRKADAATWERSVKHAARAGSGLPPSAVERRVTVGEVWTAVVAASVPRWEARTAAGYEAVWRRYVAGEWARVRVGSVTVAGIRAWVAKLHRAGLSNGTVNHAVTVLSLVMREAIARGLRADNPATGARLRATPPPPGDALAAEQLRQLLAHAGDDRAAWQLAALTGLRFGELAGLDVGDLDVTAGVLRVERAVVEVEGRQLVKPYPKSGQRRTLGVAPAILEAFDLDRSGPLWPNSRGGRQWYGAALARLRVAKKAAGITTPGGFHGLRRTAATLALQAGASTRDVQAALGHKSPQMTMTRYARPDTAAQRQVSDRLAVAVVRTESGQSSESVEDSPSSEGDGKSV